jgi:hypothetical protein
VPHSPQHIKTPIRPRSNELHFAGRRASHQADDIEILDRTSTDDDGRIHLQTLGLDSTRVAG